MIILIDPEKFQEDRKSQCIIQTFRIDLNTNFVSLINSIIKFWDLEGRDSEFEIKYLDPDNELHPIKANDVRNVDMFLKGRSNLKKARFVYISKKCSKSKNFIRKLP